MRKQAPETAVAGCCFADGQGTTSKRIKFDWARSPLANLLDHVLHEGLYSIERLITNSAVYVLAIG